MRIRRRSGQGRRWLDGGLLMAEVTVAARREILAFLV